MDIYDIELTTRIPFETKKQLGLAVQKEMRSVKDWILILDHDIMLVNPNWNYICREAISKVGHDAGWITCYTNNIGCPVQKTKDDMISTENMNSHFDYALRLQKKNSGKITDITEECKRWKLSGFFILTHKQAFIDVCLYSELPESKFIGFDNWYNDRLIERGYKLFRMDSLYVYHSYRRLWNSDEWTRGIIGYE